MQVAVLFLNIPPW